jgi:hypothetical protein
LRRALARPKRAKKSTAFVIFMAFVFVHVQYIVIDVISNPRNR